jgi:flagellar FliL protein
MSDVVEEAGTPKPSRFGKLKWAIGALVLVAAGAGAGVGVAMAAPETLGLAAAEATEGEEGEDDAHGGGEGDEDDGHDAPKDAHGAKDDGHGAPSGGHGAPSGHGAEAEPPKKKTGPILVPVDPFTINLKGSGGARVLRVRMELQTDAKHEEKVLMNMSRLRDAVLTLGGDYTWADLEGADGKMRLRDEILARIDSFHDKGLVDELFFTEFVVQ